jgi:hypothetical protein
MPNPNCHFHCTGCTRDKPDAPQEKMINGIAHVSVRPACHPEVEIHPYMRGRNIPETQEQMEQQASPVHQPGAEVW